MIYRAFFLLLIGINLAVRGQPSYHEAVMQGLRFQIQADSIQRLLEAKTLALAAASNTEKSSIRSSIIEYDIKVMTFQKLADERFTQAIALESQSSNWAVNDISVEDVRKEKVVVVAAKFSILPNSPYSASNPIPVDEPLPDGTVYKIQLGAFSRPVSPSAFRGLTPISGESLENGIIKYYAGQFGLYPDADEALRKVREYGFKDAYIVAFYNRKTISVERARQLE